MKKFHQNKKFKLFKEVRQANAQINKVNPEGTRKVRRMKAAHSRKSPKVTRDPNHWYKRIVKEMKENKQVIELVVSGKVDKLLK